MDTFKLDATLTVQDAGGGMPSGIWTEGARLLEQLSVKRSVPLPIDLTTDDPYTVELPAGFDGVHALAAKVLGGSEVTMGATSAKGTDQQIPIDPVAFAMSRTTPFTGFTLTRTPGVLTSVILWVAEKS